MFVDVIDGAGFRPGCQKCERLLLVDVVRGLWYPKAEPDGPLGDMFDD
jgi:hypothetical protein